MLWKESKDKTEDAFGVRVFGAIAQTGFGIREQQILTNAAWPCVGVSEVQQVGGFANKETDMSDGRGVVWEVEDFAHPSEPREFVDDFVDIFERDIADGVACGEHRERDALFPARPFPQGRGDGLVITLEIGAADGFGGGENDAAFVVFYQPLGKGEVVAVGKVDLAVFVADLLEEWDGLGFAVGKCVSHHGFEVGDAIKTVAPIDRVTIIARFRAFTERAVAVRCAKQHLAEKAEALVKVEMCLTPTQERIQLFCRKAI